MIVAQAIMVIGRVGWGVGSVNITPCSVGHYQGHYITLSASLGKASYIVAGTVQYACMASRKALHGHDRLGCILPYW